MTLKYLPQQKKESGFDQKPMPEFKGLSLGALNATGDNNKAVREKIKFEVIKHQITPNL